MSIYILNRQSIIKQTVQNMIEAGVILPEETDMFTGQLLKLSSNDLALALLESYNLREMYVAKQNYYQIDKEALCPN